jgi:hypothetical protein
MKQFKNLKRAANRGHILAHNGNHGLELFIRVKSNKFGCGDHSRWFKGISPPKFSKLVRY